MESGARRISARLAAGLTSAPACDSARRKLEDIVLKIGNTAHFRRTVAGLCLVAAPLLFAAAEIATPQPSGNAAAQLASYAQHRDQLLAGLLCGIASSMLRSEEHTSELQSRSDLVCRLLLEKKK